MTENTTAATGSPLVKRGLAEMLKGGVIMDVVTPEQARIAEDAGVAAIALHAYWLSLRSTRPAKAPLHAARMPGRNEPCICGSGKKFKHCCLH